MRVFDKNSVIVPAGKYVLGDPCYTVPSHLWGELLNTCGIFGLEDPGGPVGTLEFNGKVYYILGFGTHHGDGCYLDNHGREFGVDAGLIGLVPLELALEADTLDTSLVAVVEFKEDATCINQDGDMYFGHINIDTAYEPVYEEEY